MERFEQLVKALRCKRDDCDGCDIAFFDKDEGWMCRYAAKDDDAADAIEALYHQTDILANAIKLLTEGRERLLSQLPKRGEWVGVSPTVDTVECSVCGGQLFSAELETPYCPYCGAKMEVQDDD